MAELEQIEGTVEDIIYENEDNGYTVFELSGGGVVTVVCGIVGELHAGESVVCLSLIHISEPTRRTPISYAVFCLKKKKQKKKHT